MNVGQSDLTTKIQMILRWQYRGTESNFLLSSNGNLASLDQLREGRKKNQGKVDNSLWQHKRNTSIFVTGGLEKYCSYPS